MPSCNSQTIRESGDAVLRCTNIENCPDQIKGQIKHFVSKNSLDIDGVGDKLIDSLVDQKLLIHIVIFLNLPILILKR